MTVRLTNEIRKTGKEKMKNTNAFKKETNKAKLPHGFSDQTAVDLLNTEKIINIIREIYELYGFEALETPHIEYTNVLGKFLPDQDRPNNGVFSFQDDDKKWLSLRYDLTAPLARYVAANFETLPKPYRSYRNGWVFRNEKAALGRFRQFLQFDADIVNTENITADAEICMMASDTLEHLGMKKDDYIIRINNRKVLDGLMETIGLDQTKEYQKQLTAFRAIDKLDKFGKEGVALLLGKGRLDKSGDFTKGANLDEVQIKHILDFISLGTETNSKTIDNFYQIVKNSPKGLEGVREIEEIQKLLSITGYENRIKIDPSVVRGLEYYTGLIFEIDLLKGKQNQLTIGSIGGGGRYSKLISRFRPGLITATGLSLGVSRIITALHHLNKLNNEQKIGPVVIVVLEHDLEALSHYQRMVTNLRNHAIRAEVYVGTSDLKAQMKYANKRRAPCVIIQGSLERRTQTVAIKDLAEGSRLSTTIQDNKTWREKRPAQITVHENQMIQEIKRILAIK
ncbi:MAG: histidyl-tRNA synthetase [Candidatus Tokpelaia sp. JSC161]|jgi:histidyl-tRNA synthetase|nr:MAG: histidyl-tRNA synthetase [Candidatus Tokpelaia sp. JSC161]